MGAELPKIEEEEFCRRLARVAPGRLDADLGRRLHLHYLELRRWNRRLSLVGPGTRDEVVERHYGESLAALPWVGDEDRILVDVGSGAGFPGLVLAAACPKLTVALVEARQRKWAFLLAAADRCGLSVLCVNATVDARLPDELPTPIDLVTVRAVRLADREAAALRQGSSPSGRLWAWAGRGDPGELAGWRPTRHLALEGSESRRLIEYRRTDSSP